MGIVSLIFLSMGLAADALAVAIACSIAQRRVTKRQVFRFAFHFGLFQALMPLLGWVFGTAAHRHVAAWDHWLALGLLLFVGIKAIREALKDDEEETDMEYDPTRGLSLIAFSVATSIDAFAVGLSLAFLETRIWVAAAVIGVITAVLTMFGMVYGARLGGRFGQRMSIAGGLILIGIGLKIFVSHQFLGSGVPSL